MNEAIGEVVKQPEGGGEYLWPSCFGRYESLRSRNIGFCQHETLQGRRAQQEIYIYNNFFHSFSHLARSEVSNYWCALFCVIKSKSSLFITVDDDVFKSKEVM